MSSDEDESVESSTEATGEDDQEPPDATPLLPTTAFSSTPPSALRNQGLFWLGLDRFLTEES